MRLNTAYLIGLAMAATPLLSVTALSASPERATDTRSGQIILAADPCPPGEYWEPGGYVADGKWRDPHCAKDNGRQ